jgi:hypothetical protein
MKCIRSMPKMKIITIEKKTLILVVNNDYNSLLPFLISFFKIIQFLNLFLFII